MPMPMHAKLLSQGSLLTPGDVVVVRRPWRSAQSTKPAARVLPKSGSPATKGYRARPLAVALREGDGLDRGHSGEQGHALSLSGRATGIGTGGTGTGTGAKTAPSSGAVCSEAYARWTVEAVISGVYRVPS